MPRPPRSKAGGPKPALARPGGADRPDDRDREIERLRAELGAASVSLTVARAQVTEGLEREMATAHVLGVIRRTQTDAQPVFDTITESAVRLCRGDFGTVFLLDNGVVRPAASYNATGEGVAALARVFGGPPTLETVTGRAILTGEIVHRPDAQHATDVPGTVQMARAWPYGAIVSVPLLRDGEAIGTVNVAKGRVGPFSDREIALLRTFADQAVIALENVRLFTELQARNRDLTATSQILSVIAASPTDVQPVFEAIVASAQALIAAETSAVFVVSGHQVDVAAVDGGSPDVVAKWRAQYRATPRRTRWWGEPCLSARRSTSPTSQPTRATRLHRGVCSAFRPFSRCRCSGMGSRSA